MGTISFEHLKKNLLSGNYDKYHLPLFLRNSNINFMPYAWRYEFFFLQRVYVRLPFSILLVNALLSFFLSFVRSSRYFFSPNLSFSLFPSVCLTSENVRLLLLRVWSSLWWQHSNQNAATNIAHHRLHEAKGFLFGDQVTYLTVIKK